MKVEFKITAENEQELKAIASFLLGEEKPVAKKTTRKRKTKEETKKVEEPVADEPQPDVQDVKVEVEAPAEPEPEPEVEAPAEPEVEAPAEPKTKKEEPATAEMVRSVAKDLIQAGKGAEVTAAIRKAGGTTISSIPDDKLTEVYHALRKVRQNG